MDEKMNEEFDNTWMSRLCDAAQAATAEASMRDHGFIYFDQDLEPKFMTLDQIKSLINKPKVDSQIIIAPY